MITWSAMRRSEQDAAGTALTDVRDQLIRAMSQAIGTENFSGLSAATLIVAAEIDRYSDDLARRADAARAGDRSVLR